MLVRGTSEPADSGRTSRNRSPCIPIALRYPRSNVSLHDALLEFGTLIFSSIKVEIRQNGCCDCGECGSRFGAECGTSMTDQCACHQMSQWIHRSIPSGTLHVSLFLQITKATQPFLDPTCLRRCKGHLTLFGTILFRVRIFRVCHERIPGYQGESVGLPSGGDCSETIENCDADILN